RLLFRVVFRFWSVVIIMLFLLRSFTSGFVIVWRFVVTIRSAFVIAFIVLRWLLLLLASAVFSGVVTVMWSVVARLIVFLVALFLIRSVAIVAVVPVLSAFLLLTDFFQRVE